MKKILLLTLAYLLTFAHVYGADVSANPMLWHGVSVTFTGPQVTESATTFLNYRLNVTFVSPSGNTYVVPGYFAADGNAGESGATSGTQWRVRFAPDEVGQWSYTASFRMGTNVAIDLSPTAGTATSFNGENGVFQVSASDKTGKDFRAKGMLRYVGEHYLQFAGSKTYFLKGGTGSPENLLAYQDFDNTFNNGGTYYPSLGTSQLHVYGPHLNDWTNGDPTWKSGKGKSLIGALNYISSKNINAAYILLMNVEGDGQDLWPWTGPNNREIYDISKLDQWEVVFSHMDKVGMMHDFMLTETENESLFELKDGGGTFAHTRKLYYREMIARFGHHLGVTWNLGEENGHTTDLNASPFGVATTSQQMKDFSKYIKDQDPYDHHVVVHNWPETEASTFGPLLGYSYFDGVSIQEHLQYNDEVRNWVNQSDVAGRKWIVAVDEPLGWEFGLRPDAVDPTHDQPRKDVLWGTYMAGGAGVDWYFGWQNNAPTSDLSNEDWRNRNNMWEQTDHALKFFNTHVPFHLMHSENALTPSTDDYVFAANNECYVIYLKNGGAASINLSSTTETFDVKWYDPRNGGNLINGTVASAIGGGTVSLGSPPNNTTKDWVVLLKVVSNGPRMRLSDNETTFKMKPFVLSTVSPTKRTITLTNIGTDNLSGVAAVSDKNWLTVNFTDNIGNDQIFEVSINQNAEALAKGVHTAAVTVSAGNANPVVLTVRLSVFDECLLNEVFDDNTVKFVNYQGTQFSSTESAGAWALQSGNHGEWDFIRYTINDGFSATPIDFSDPDAMPKLTIKMRTSVPALVRVSLADANGVEAQNANLLKINNIEVGTNYTVYTIDFTGLFYDEWVANKALDLTSISNVIIRLNPGFQSGPHVGQIKTYNTAFTGTLYVDEIKIGNCSPLTGTMDKIEKESVQIFPNPGSGSFQIKAGGVTTPFNRIVVINMMGEEILIQDYSTSIEQSEIDLSQQPDGVYMVRIQSEDAYFTGQLIKTGH